MKKILSTLLALSLCITSLTACGNSTQEQQDSSTAQNDRRTMELQMSDYRGSVVRTQVIRDKVIEIVDNMKSNNQVIRTDNPNSFWTMNGYQDFVSNFLNDEIIKDTENFTEEEGSWDTVLSMLQPSGDDVDSSEYPFASATITRNEKDDYSITGLQGNLNGSSKYSGDLQYRILYDCDKDWSKAYCHLVLTNDLPSPVTDMFEYARLNNDTFVIQTSKERLLIVLEPAEADTDIRDRKIKEFYYSKLTVDGERTTFTPFKQLPEVDGATGEVNNENADINAKMEDYAEMNENGDFSTQYGETESIFYRTSESLNSNWVFEDKSLQQAIIYKDGILVVTSYNKLTDTYDRFIYALAEADEKNLKPIENMVNIDSLVGVQAKRKNVLTVQKTDGETNSADSADNSSSSDSSSENSSSSEPESSVAENNSSGVETSSIAENTETSSQEDSSER